MVQNSSVDPESEGKNQELVLLKTKIRNMRPQVEALGTELNRDPQKTFTTCESLLDDLKLAQEAAGNLGSKKEHQQIVADLKQLSSTITRRKEQARENMVILKRYEDGTLKEIAQAKLPRELVNLGILAMICILASVGIGLTMFVFFLVTAAQSGALGVGGLMILIFGSLAGGKRYQKYNGQKKQYMAKVQAERSAEQQAVELQAKRDVTAQAQRQETESQLIQKLQEVIPYATKLPVARIAKILEMDLDATWERVFEWAEKFNFLVDGDFLVFNKDTVNDFMALLDQEFKEWKGESKGS